MRDTDLDQIFTTAGAAMLFAVADWDRFHEFMMKVNGRVPVSREQMSRDSVRILLMVDPMRLPDV